MERIQLTTNILGRAALSVILLSTSLTLAKALTGENGREHILFDAGWKFQAGEKEGVGGTPIKSWSYANTESAAKGIPDTDSGSLDPNMKWSVAKPGQDTFAHKKGFQWFQTTLPSLDGPGRILRFDGVDDNATVYLNGKKLTHHEGWNEPFEVSLDSAWKTDRENRLSVLVENTDQAGGMGKAFLTLQKTDDPSLPASPAYDDKSWRSVHLPHDFVVENEFSPDSDPSHGSLPTGVGWYRKRFTLSKGDMGKRLSLEFDGAYRNSSVWLNGKKLGEQKSGYIGFSFDIGSTAKFGEENIVTVRTDARSQEGWWYEGGGIYRHVWLNKTAPLHIDRDSVFVVSEPNGASNAKVGIKVAVLNEGKYLANCRVVNSILAPDGKEVARIEVDQRIPAQEEVQSSPAILFANPKLWSIETPNLYQLVTRVEQNGKIIDSVTTIFGIRTVKFDADKGLFINGKSVKIKGTCNHQDFAGVGIAMPDSLLEWRIKLLKTMGSNAYRCSHNPPAKELLDACDRLGMIVMDETRHLGDTYGAKTSAGTKFDDLSDLKALVIRDRNHPSVILWSMCNEEGLQGSAEGAKIFSAMMKKTKELDPTRPVSCAMNGGWGQGISLVQDLQGCNYNPGGYDQFHKNHPTLPMFGSETASEVGTRGEYANDEKRGYVSAYSVNAPSWAQTCEVAWKALGEREYMAGGFVWTGFDYKGEPTPYAWPCINSHFGIMDECGFPKDAYYYYQSWWSDKNVVHLLPHWNWKGKEGQLINVWCHSNAETVELFLNGASLGSKAMPKLGHLEWNVPYAPGKLEAKGYRNGKLIAADVVETTGEATQIVLSPDRTSLKADGEDVVMVSVSLLDSKGRLVPFAENEVTFAVAGAGQVAGVGNGDPSSHEPDRASKRKAYHGLCMAVIQAGDKSGKLELSATAPGLKSAKIELRVK